MLLLFTEEHLTMNTQETQRFGFLRQGPYTPAPIDYVQEYYGLPWPLPAELGQNFSAWREGLPTSKRSSHREGHVSRFEIEAFMEDTGVAPKKWLAARLGMQVQSLEELLNRIKEIGLRRERYVACDHLIDKAYDDLIHESLAEDLVRNLPGLRFRSLSDDTASWEMVHREIRSALGVEVQPLYCKTSEHLGESPRLLARDFDCITLEPVSGRHQMWLDFRKPLTLGPDRCSKLFYVENREDLRPYCVGTQEPDDLEDYVQFLAVQQDG
jgi:hypothetical protein